MSGTYEDGYAEGYEQGRDDMAVHLIWAVRAVYEATPHYPGMRMVEELAKAIKAAEYWRRKLDLDIPGWPEEMR